MYKTEPNIFPGDIEIIYGHNISGGNLTLKGTSPAYDAAFQAFNYTITLYTEVDGFSLSTKYTIRVMQQAPIKEINAPECLNEPIPMIYQCPY